MKKPENSLSINRRKMLQLLGALGSSFALSGCRESTLSVKKQSTKDTTATSPPSRLSPAKIEDPLLQNDVKRDNFIVHNEKPMALESLREQHSSSPITPIEKLFVRNNLPMPSADIIQRAPEWVLELDDRKITLSELKTLPVVHETAVLQCSGNGRGFFTHKVSGSPWRTGAAGCVMWTGVRIKDVLELLGIEPSPAQKYLTATGGEPLPEGVERDKVVVERSIPLEKGLKDCLLAWEVNGLPIPITHGGPLRLIVPGYFGCNQIKYVKKIALTAEQSTAKIQRTGYRFRPIGEKGSPDQPSLWRMPVKSWLVGATTVQKGWNSFFGYAFSGERGIRSVHYSTDGKNWKEAVLLSPDLGKNAWRAFQIRLALPLGTHQIFTRATDRQNEEQPELRIENERGYRHNGWRDHAQTITVVEESTTNVQPIAPTQSKSEATAATHQAAPIKLSDAGERGQKIFTEGTEPSCGVCHTLEHAGTSGAIGPNLNQLQPSLDQVQQAVAHGVGAMPEFSGQLTAEQIKDIASYIVETTKR